MRPGPNNNNNKRSRGRHGGGHNGGHGGGNGGGGQPQQNQNRGGGGGRSALSMRHQTFDSNGPDVRVRGTASQVYEKYQSMARDSAANGDRVLSENYLQHAEHYYRIVEAINTAIAAEQVRLQAQNPGAYGAAEQPDGSSNPSTGFGSQQPPARMDGQYQAQSPAAPADGGATVSSTRPPPVTQAESGAMTSLLTSENLADIRAEDDLRAVG